MDATVSGATTDTILRTSQRRGGRRFPPQIESLDPRKPVDVVTITAGGNDLDYLGSVIRAALAGRLSRRFATAPVARWLRSHDDRARSDAVAMVADGLIEVIEAVSARAPRARIVLVDYLTIIGPETRASERLPFAAGDLSRLRDRADVLAHAFRRAESASRAELVAVSALSETHGFDAAAPWVNGLNADFPFRRLGSSFHPNAEGMRAVSEAVVRHLQ